MVDWWLERLKHIFDEHKTRQFQVKEWLAPFQGYEHGTGGDGELTTVSEEKEK